MVDELRRVQIVTNAEEERQQLKRVFGQYQQQHAADARRVEAARDERSAAQIRSMKSYVQSVIQRYYVVPFRRLAGAAGGPAGGAVAKAATTPPRQWFGNIKSFVAGWITANLLSPLGILGSAVGGTLIMFAAPLLSGAMKAPFQIAKAGFNIGRMFGPVGAVVGGAVGIAAGVGVAALALKFVVAPLFWLGTTLKLTRLTYGWAQEVADDQVRIIGRTRRTFPGVIGAEFDQAQDVMRTKLEVAGALFGNSADAMMEGFNRKLQMASKDGGVGGVKDIFRDLGLTQGSVRAYEEIIAGGQRMTLTDWLYLFIKKREDLEAKIQEAPKGSAELADLSRRKALVLDHALQLFGQRFSEIAGAFTTGDWQTLNENIKKANPLAKVGDAADRTRKFNIAFGTIRETFSQLKRGISGDVMPKLTDIMERVRTWLVSTTSDGQSMGMKFRKLGAALAVHAWETLSELLSRVKPEDIKALIEPIKNWKVENVTKVVETTVSFLGKLANGILLLTEWVAWIINSIHQLKESWKKYGVVRGTAVELHKDIDTLMGWVAGTSARAFAGGKNAMIEAYRKVGYGAGGGPAGGGRGGTAGGGGAGGGWGGGGLKAGSVTGESGGVKITGSGHSATADPQSLYHALVKKFRASKVNNWAPPDGAKYGIVTGSAEEWAKLGVALAGSESDFRVNPKVERNPKMAHIWGSDVNPQGPAGLFQFGWKDLKSRGLGTDVTNVDAQMTAMVRNMERAKEVGVMAQRVPGPKRWAGAAEHFGPIRAVAAGTPHRISREWFGKSEQIARAAGAVPVGGEAGATREYAEAMGPGGPGNVVQRTGGKQRSLPLEPQLQSILNQAAQASGVAEVSVTSGGQRPWARAKGASVRHDIGVGGIGAADVELYVGQGGNKRKLNMNNSEDRAIMANFMKQAVARGATGIGAAPGYMGVSTIHVGGGTPSAWGAGGKGANAPDWVRQAHAAGFELRKRRVASGNLTFGGGIYEKRAPDILEALKLEFGLTTNQAAATVGNAGKESWGFRSLQETEPVVKGSKGGYGIMQWTGDRRDKYMEWCRRNELDPASNEANVGYLTKEMRVAKTKTGENFLESLKKTDTLEEASRLVHEHYLRPADSQSKYWGKMIRGRSKKAGPIRKFESAEERLQYARAAIGYYEKKQATKLAAALEAAENIPVPKSQILMAQAPKAAVDEGKAAGEAAAEALKAGIKDVNFPIRSMTTAEQERAEEQVQKKAA